jgi:hypothetical protein
MTQIMFNQFRCKVQKDTRVVLHTCWSSAIFAKCCIAANTVIVPTCTGVMYDPGGITVAEIAAENGGNRTLAAQAMARQG